MEPAEQELDLEVRVTVDDTGASSYDIVDGGRDYTVDDIVTLSAPIQAVPSKLKSRRWGDHMPSNVPGMSAGLGDEMSSIPLGKIIGGPHGDSQRHKVPRRTAPSDSCKKVAWTITAMLPCGARSPPDSSAQNLSVGTNHGFDAETVSFQGRQTNILCLTDTIPWDKWFDTTSTNRFFVAKTSVDSAIEPGNVTVNWETSWREVSRLNIRTINFAYDQQVQTETGTSYNNHNVTIPLMAMVPIPYLRIDTMDLDFSVKLTGVEKTAQVDRFSAKARAGYGGKKFGVTAAFAHRSSKGQSKQISRSYSLQVKVRASQGEMPVGVERMINLMDNLITDDIAEIED